MRLWREQVVPRVTDAWTTAETRALRRRTCTGLHGHVLEIGFGSGLNLPQYPAGVTAVTAVEPSRVGRALAARRIAASPAPVTFSGLDAAALPFPDDCFDSALSTLTLCTVGDPHAAVAEVHRVLKPGGNFHFLEHGHAPDAGVARWQRRLEPLQKKVFAGCHLTRDIAALVAAPAFTVDIEGFYLPGPAATRPFAYLYLGQARKPSVDPST